MERPVSSFRIDNGERARIREATSQRMYDVSVAELRGLPSFAPEEFNERLERQRKSNKEQWSNAERREDIIRRRQIRKIGSEPAKLLHKDKVC
jgi:hypothetical protein